ncbi:MAG: hypothetical protein AMK72_00900 [Planctomycetes bacterium SM23_25]|nr:MAG: hypothetical protein AMK72_00900 [Planctomycetes bacterium SM23_25]
MTRAKAVPRRRMAAVLVALALTASGCQVPVQFLVWAFAPRHPKKTIKAEYDLRAERLAIVPYAGTDILFTYPAAPIEVSRDLVNELVGQCKDRVKTIVHPVEVVRWQESNLEWPNMTLEDIAKAFQADTVLYVELEQYTMIEERSANLFRGRVRARVQVVKADGARNPVYETTVETVFPEDRPVGVLEESERRIRAAVTRFFARDVIRKFYDHEVPDQGGRM